MLQFIISVKIFQPSHDLISGHIATFECRLIASKTDFKYSMSFSVGESHVQRNVLPGERVSMVLLLLITIHTQHLYLGDISSLTYAKLAWGRSYMQSHYLQPSYTEKDNFESFL